MQDANTDEPRDNSALSFSRRRSSKQHSGTQHTDAVNIKRNNLETEGSDIEGQHLDCELCGKTFQSLKKLKRHEDQVHYGEKKYKCDKCMKSFFTGLKLKDHKRSHTGSGSFECEVCQKCFPSNSSLFRHSRVHLEEKPFKCDDCEKGFNQKGNLKSHIQNCHNKELSVVLSKSFNNDHVSDVETMEMDGDFPVALEEGEEMDDEKESNVIEGIVTKVLE